MILSFAVRHCLSSAAIVNLLELVNALAGKVVFGATKAVLKKLFAKEVLSLTYHFYCSFCYSYVNSFQVLTADHESCSNCNRDCSVKDLSQGNFFITSDLTSEMRTLLENENISKHLSYKRTREQNPSHINDIYDGTVYQELSKEGGPLQNSSNLSYIINSDGVPVFTSSKYSLWPIYIMINELPPKLRFQNLILAGVWFGKCEPKMEMFLSKFVDQTKALAEEGVFWKQGEDIVHITFFAICCCVDAPARAAMQNHIRFNGYYGCSLCYHPGKLVDRTVKYPIDVCNYNDRTNDELLQDMVQAVEDGRNVRGVKGPSAFVNLLHFPICWGFPPCFMHCLLLGVVRQVAELWFSSSPENEYYIGAPRKIDACK